jgi:hypothetical protein
VRRRRRRPRPRLAALRLVLQMACMLRPPVESAPLAFSGAVRPRQRAQARRNYAQRANARREGQLWSYNGARALHGTLLGRLAAKLNSDLSQPATGAPAALVRGFRPLCLLSCPPSLFPRWITLRRHAP